MKAHLLFPDRDLNLSPPLPANMSDLTQDLELEALFNAMSNGDKFLYQIARDVLFAGLQNDVETILYRQAILKDCLSHYDIIEKIDALVISAIENERRRWFSIFPSRHPGGTLYSAVELLEMFTDTLGKLKLIAETESPRFSSQGFKTFFTSLRTELTDDYLSVIRSHLAELKFRKGVLISAELGRGNEGTHYVLRKAPNKSLGWVERLFLDRPAGFSFHVAERDEAGLQTLEELKDRGINQTANVVAQSADHILSYFSTIHRELGFYIGCVNLHRLLSQKDIPLSFPIPSPPDILNHSGRNIHDACLALHLPTRTVGNNLDADGKNLVVITGANQGGKSTFLRAIGVAQLMMQCGLFVTAESFRANVCDGLFTHYKREEDASMTSGKFDEELSRMSHIVDAVTPHSLFLFNESFAATNEREGSEIAKQIVHSLLKAHFKIFFVTHMYEFAHGLFDKLSEQALFLRAERNTDGHRTFKLLLGEPLETSFGVDLYKKIFGKEMTKTEVM